MKPAFRILITLFALVLGGLLVYGLTLFGKQSEGPIEDVLTYSGEMVRKAEDEMILQKQTKLRSDKMPWFRLVQGSRDWLCAPNRILLGAFDNQATESLQNIVSLEDSIGTEFPLVQIYAAWGSAPDQQFPAVKVDAIFKFGSVPVITWEPWISAFSADDIPGMRPPETRDKSGLRDVAAGMYDAYLHTWAKAAAKVGRPFFLRFAHEMNDAYRYPWGQQNNSPADFVAAWRHVHNLFAADGASNVIWIWSPHPAHGLFKEYYPGDAYVDYVGVGSLNYGTVANWSQWWSFQDIFGQYYPALSAFHKPMMLTEFGCLPIGGDRAQWFSDALNDLPARYPALKSILFFHYSDDRTTTQEALNWYFKDDRKTTAAIRKAIQSWQ